MSNRGECEMTDRPKVWLLRRPGSIGYDEYDSKVVVAHTQEDARYWANVNTGDEGMIWNDPNEVLCSEIDYEHEYVLLESFNAG